MKMNIKNIAMAGIMVAGMSSCGDYLNTSSPSTADAEFVFSNSVTAQAALEGAYSFWHQAMLNNVFCNAEFYGLDAAGSDIEKNPESYSSQTRHIPLSFYEGGSVASTFEVTNWNAQGKDAFSRLYVAIGGANNILGAIKADDIKDPKILQLYGEAVCIRATAYRELIRYYGDVPYQAGIGAPVEGLTARCYIYDKCIEDLEAIAPKMTAAKANAKNKFSSTYAYALLGRMCLEAAGYQLYRDDVKQVNGKGEDVELLCDQEWHYDNLPGTKYARRADYMDYYRKAEKAFTACKDNLGDVKFNDNDYFEFFDQIHGSDNGFATESIFEDAITQGGGDNSERPYAFGRPAAGNGSNAFPCKNYGQTRIQPVFYYGMFDPKDKRRDIAVAVTVSNGDGTEVLTTMKPGNCLNGGLALNKFDENRQTIVYTAKQRKSGINIPYMRVAEVYLGLAEALAAQGDLKGAAQWYNKTHVRAGFEPKGQVTLEEVIDERGFEFAGEGDRRWTLIRTGLIGKKIQAMKDLTAKMLDGLNSPDGFYRFDNGNEISRQVYVKAVAPGTYGVSSRLVKFTGVHEGGYEPENEAMAMQFPGWRGQHDWHVDGGAKVLYAGKSINDGESNLCIRGLFKHLDEAPEGYTAKPWGQGILDNKEEYYDNQFKNWNTHTAPLYLVPFNENECNSSNITNGYGFKKY